MMYTEEEKARIKQQVEHDKTHYITEGLTIYQWKEKFKDDLFIQESYYEREVEKMNGDSNVKVRVRCNAGEKGAYLMPRVIINPKNFGIAKAVRKQVIIYGETLPQEEIQLYCFEIISKAIEKFEVRDKYYEENEYGKLASYILTCLDTEIQNFVNDYTETFRERIDGTDRIFSPKMMMSYDVEVDENDKYNDDRHIDYVLEEQNLFTIFDEYEPTDTLKIILNTLQSDLTEEQTELMQILAITENNNVETAKIIKGLSIERGKELRSSDDAYRIAVIREKAKIVKLVEKNLDLHKLENIAKLKLEQREINNFLEMDINEKQIVDYTIANINEYYIDNIVYEQLGIEQRQYLIKNFIHTYNEDKLQHKETKALCRYILNGLYNHIDVLGKKINDLNVTKVEDFETPTEPKKVCPKTKEIYKYKYYVEKDKFERLEGYKDMEILGEKIFTVTDGSNSKYIMDCYYLGESKDTSKERKQEFGKIDQRGMRYRINQTTTESEKLDEMSNSVHLAFIY